MFPPALPLKRFMKLKMLENQKEVQTEQNPFDPYDRTAPKTLEDAITPQLRIVTDSPPLKLARPWHHFQEWAGVTIGTFGGGPRFQNAGFTLTEILITAGIIGLILVLCLPYGVKSRENSTRNACFVNLKVIDGAM